MFIVDSVVIFHQWKYNTGSSAAAAAESFQSCLTLCDPIGGSPPGFSRQEHWSGSPFPSPVHESEKWKWSRSVVSDSSRPHGLQPTRLLRPWDFPGKSAGVGCHCLLQLAALREVKTVYKVGAHSFVDDAGQKLVEIETITECVDESSNGFIA